MDPKWLDDFVALARERSFSRAAQTRHVTQPQFSRRIRALELWLGTDVVQRASAPLLLTPAGELLLPVARNALTQLADVRERVQSANRGGNWITVATGRTLSRTWVPDWSRRVQTALGHDFKLRLITGSINDAVVALEQGHADFMLNYSHPRLQLTLDANLFESAAVAQEELLAVSVPTPGGLPLHSLPGTARKPVAVLRYAPTLALHHILQDALSRDGRDLHLDAVVESDFAESLHEQALAGRGLAWLPRALVHADLKTGRLVAADTSHVARFDVQLCRMRLARNPLVDAIWQASLAH